MVQHGAYALRCGHASKEPLLKEASVVPLAHEGEEICQDMAEAEASLRATAQKNNNEIRLINMKQ